ncbi:MAG: transglycosylase SLT domain-containing protein [Sporomusaceae bacterium]|nr:transglycosylase SLT domain-containing protein [Sporomusaceae bacterium]
MAANDVQIQIIGKDLASQAFQSVDRAAQRTTQNMQAFGGAVSSANSILSDAAGFAAGIAGFTALDAAIEKTLGSALEFYKTMETGSISMSGSLMSMATLSGQTIQWGQALSMSKDIMVQLSDTAIRTGVSTKELTDTFRAMLPAALNAKMTVQQTMDIASRMVPVGKGMGLNETTLMRDVADLITGQNVQRTKLGSILGISDKDIADAKKSADGLYKFLSDRLQGEKEASEHYLISLEGRVNHLKESVSRMGGTAFGSMFQAGTDEIQKMADSIVTVNKETGEVTLNPQLLNDLTYIGNEIMVAGSGIKAFAQDISVVAVPAVKILGTGLDIVANHVEAIGLGFAAWTVMGKMSALYGDYIAVTNGATTAQTFLGRAVLDTQTKYAHQAATATLAAEAERAAAVAAAEQQVQASLAGTKMETAAVAAALGQNNLAAAIAKSVVAEEEQATVTSRTAAIMESANTAMRASQLEVAQAVLATNLSIGEQAIIAEQMAARIVIAEELARTGQIELAQSILATDIALADQATAATAAGAKNVTAATTATSSQKVLTASVAATTAAHMEAGAAATIAGEKTVSAMAVAGTASGNFLKTLWALAGGWAGVAVAAGLAANAAIDYFDTKNKVESYDSKAEVYDDPSRPGKHTKKKWVEASFVMGPSDELMYVMPAHYERAPLSDAEEEEWGTWRNWKDQNDVNKPWRTQSAEDLLNNLLNKFDTTHEKNSHKKHSILDEAGDLKFILEDAASSAGVNPELFAALVKAESGFDPNASSSAGAMGLTQLMPGTAASLGVSHPYDPTENAQGGAEYLAQQLRTFGGNTRLALAAYNWGPGNVQDAVRAYGSTSWGVLRDHMPEETRNYVEGITANLEKSGHLDGLKSGNIAQKLIEYKKKITDMIASLNEEITQEDGTAYQLGMTKVNDKVAKLTAESSKMAAMGADTKQLDAKITEYQKVESEKVTRIWRQSWQDLKNQTAKTQAEIMGDPAASADTEYSAKLLQLEKDRREKQKSVMQDKNDKVAQLAVEKWYNEQVILAEMNREQKHREATLTLLGYDVQYNNDLQQLGNKSAQETDAANLAVYNKEIEYLKGQLDTAKLTIQERIDLETKLADTVKNKNDILAKNLTTAYSVAYQQIKNKTYDYANAMVQTVDDVNSTINSGFDEMLTGTKNWGDSLVNTVSNVAKRIEKLFIDMFYQKAVSGPVSEWVSGIVGSVYGSSNSTSSAATAWSAANGGAAPTLENGGLGLTGVGTGGSWLNPGKNARGGDWGGGWSWVGEEGPELAYFGSSAHIYDANTSKSMVNSSAGAAKVKLIVNNNTGTQAAVRQSSSFDADTQTTIVSLWLDAADRNVMGLRDTLKGVAG